jgi:hypothetical protein
MPKINFKSFGKALIILGGGIVVGYLKCMEDVQKKYGEVIDEDFITVEPMKKMTVGIVNSPKKNEESN